MSAKLKALLDLQDIDLQLYKAQKSRAALDDGSSKKQQVENTRQEAAKADALLHEATTELRDKELNLKTVETKRKTFKDKLYAGTVTNPKELSSMEKEIEMLGRQKDKLEERILELMDIVEERKSAAEAAHAALKEQEEELAAFMEKRRQADAVLVKHIRQLLPQREAALANVDPVLLKKYDAMRPRLGGIVVSKIQDNDCTACHTHVSSGVVHSLKSNDDLQTCDNCGRILLLEE